MIQTRLSEFMKDLKEIVRRHEGHLENYPEISAIESSKKGWTHCNMVEEVKNLMDRALIPEPIVCDKCGQILPR